MRENEIVLRCDITLIAAFESLSNVITVLGTYAAYLPPDLYLPFVYDIINTIMLTTNLRSTQLIGLVAPDPGLLGLPLHRIDSKFSIN